MSGPESKLARRLEHGVALPVWHVLATGRYADLHELAAKTAAGPVR
jgi:hypothetical protein